MSYNVPQALDQLASSFANAFPVSHRSSRKIGREAEYPVVQQDGTAADVRKLLAVLGKNGGYRPVTEGTDLLVGLEGDDYAFSLEVGLGTVEVIGRACRDLNEMEGIHQRATRELQAAADSLGYWVLGYGAQPITEASKELMSPKARYNVLHRVMRFM